MRRYEARSKPGEFCPWHVPSLLATYVNVDYDAVSLLRSLTHISGTVPSKHVMDWGAGIAESVR